MAKDSSGRVRLNLGNDENLVAKTVYIVFLILVALAFTFFVSNPFNPEIVEKSKFYTDLMIIFIGIVIADLVIRAGKKKSEAFKELLDTVTIEGVVPIFGYRKMGRGLTILLTGIAFLAMFGYILMIQGQSTLAIVEAPEFGVIAGSQLTSPIASCLAGIPEDGIFFAFIPALIFFIVAVSLNRGLGISGTRLFAIAFLIALFASPVVFAGYHSYRYGAIPEKISSVYGYGVVSTGINTAFGFIPISHGLHCGNNFAVTYFKENQTDISGIIIFLMVLTILAMVGLYWKFRRK